MNRRDFIKMLGVTGGTLAASDLAIGALAGYLEPLPGRLEHLIQWSTHRMDYDNQVGIAARFPDGRRHAIAVYAREMTPSTEHHMKQALLTWWRDQQNADEV